MKYTIFDSKETPDTPITDALTGVLKGNYDDKVIQTERVVLKDGTAQTEKDRGSTCGRN